MQARSRLTLELLLRKNDTRPRENVGLQKSKRMKRLLPRGSPGEQGGGPVVSDTLPLGGLDEHGPDAQNGDSNASLLAD